MPKPQENLVLLNDDGELAILELKQCRSLRLRTLRFNLRWREVNRSARPTNGLLFPDIPIAEVTLADEAKVADDCRTALRMSDCLVNL